ncbi:MAG: endopeptidase La, partial [Parasporobacterium sp.]|nr:endopeptidase La [Parasporobacterium sp.]
MITVPVYNMIILPGVTFYFQGSYFRELSGTEAAVGDEIVFLVVKEEKEKKDLKPEDFETVGVFGTVESINEEGSVGIRTQKRITVEAVISEGESLTVTFSDREEDDDISQEEKSTRFVALRSALLQFVSGFQWGMIVRSYIMQWKSMGEMTAMMSSRLTISPNEKY